MRVERFGEPGRRYAIRHRAMAPRAPLAPLNEVLEREKNYDAALVTGILESPVRYRILKRGALSRFCHRLSKLHGSTSHHQRHF